MALVHRQQRQQQPRLPRQGIGSPVARPIHTVVVFPITRVNLLSTHLNAAPLARGRLIGPIRILLTEVQPGHRQPAKPPQLSPKLSKLAMF